jgi:DNA-binding GntR family transcriptional regulator
VRQPEEPDRRRIAVAIEAVPAEERTTRGEEVARQLADDIVQGRLPPGDKLDEQEVARRFGTSRTPVREALNQLCALGLTERLPFRGVVVATISTQRLGDMFGVMAELESSAARLAALAMTAGERQNLQDLHAAARLAVQRGAREEYAAFNTRFHSLLYAGSHNSYLEELLIATRKRLAPFRHAQFSLIGRLPSSHREHEAVVEAILRADAEGAARAMRTHVLTVSAASATLVDHQTARNR